MSRAWGGRQQVAPRTPRAAEGILTAFPETDVVGWRAVLSIRCFTGTPGDPEAPPNWTSFSKGWKRAAFQGKIALGYLGTADTSQNTNFVKGYDFLAVGKLNKSS